MSGPLVVVGDALLDRDVTGAVSRLCPDAPVPVLNERSATELLAGYPAVACRRTLSR